MIGSISCISISSGGVPKLPVPTAEITLAGLVGDRQKNRKHHGGPDRAVCLLGQDIIDHLCAQGHPIQPGSTGDNLTISGLDWTTVDRGDRFHLGNQVVLEITSHAAPCRTIADSFLTKDFSCLDHRRFPGQSRLYARVVVAGHVTIGDTVNWIRVGTSP